MAYWALKALLSPIFALLWRVKVEGRGHVPSQGPVIIAPNHIAFCDSLFVPLVVRRRVTFVAKSEYFDTWKTSWFFRAVGQIPMRREGGSASQRALDTARGVVESGRVLGIYPEGTRSPDGRLYRGHTGVARLALATGASLVPVGVIGTTDIQPKGRRFMRPFRRVIVRFGEPIDLGRFGDDSADDPLVLRRVTDELMFEIRQLTGQQYVDRYAKKPAPSGDGTAPLASVQGSGDGHVGAGSDGGAPEVAGSGSLREAAGSTDPAA